MFVVVVCCLLLQPLLVALALALAVTVAVVVISVSVRRMVAQISCARVSQSASQPGRQAVSKAAKLSN